MNEVDGKGLATGWTVQQHGNLVTAAGVMGEIVIRGQHVATGFREVFCDTGRRIRRNEGETGPVVSRGHGHHGVIHRVPLSQVDDDLRHGGSALADRTIDSDDMLALMERTACHSLPRLFVGSGRWARRVTRQRRSEKKGRS
jgi:hypothetical protein